MIIKEVEPTFFRQFKQVDLENHMKVNVKKKVAYICFIGQYAL
jgi:hypothetical protein